MMTFLLQKKQLVFHWNVAWLDLSLDFFVDGWGAESDEHFAHFGSRYARRHFGYTSTLPTGSCSFYLSRSSWSKVWSCKIRVWSKYDQTMILQNSVRLGIPFVTTLVFSVLVEKSPKQITQLFSMKFNDSIPIWFLFHFNLNDKSNAEISYFTTHKIYRELFFILK